MNSDPLSIFANLGATGVALYIVYVQAKNYKELTGRILNIQENTINTQGHLTSAIDKLSGKIEEGIAVTEKTYTLVKNHCEILGPTPRKLNNIRRRFNKQII